MLADTILALALLCAPQVDPETILQVVQVEAQPLGKNRYNPNTLNINRSKRQFKPTTAKSAAQIARYFIKQGKTVDIGLMQINSWHLRYLDYSITDLLKPCINIRVGGQILADFYHRTPKNQTTDHRLIQALSGYNTGNFTDGLKNGYVERHWKTYLKRIQ